MGTWLSGPNNNDNYFSGDPIAETADGLGGNDVLVGADGNDILFGNTGDDDLYGQRDDDRLFGGDGTDYINAFTGNDLLDGGAGDDELLGGAGDDTYQADNGDTIYEAPGEGIDTVYVTQSHLYSAYNVPENVEYVFGTMLTQGLFFRGNYQDNWIGGTAYADTLSGSSGSDTLDGGGGNDLIYNTTVRSAYGDDGSPDRLDGSIGNDRLIGGIGDTLIGGTGDDEFDVTHASVAITENLNEGTDAVVSHIASFTLGANLENLTLASLLGSSPIALRGTGNALANTLSGNLGDNVLRGLNGRDVLLGAAGNDTLNGGAAADTLDGASGLDVLVGGPGDDTLTGGGGADDFVLDQPLGPQNVDEITDFVAGTDAVHLDEAVMAQLGAVGVLAAAAFYIGGNAHDATDRIIYNATTGRLFYDADGGGGATKIWIATLDAGLALTNSDFLVI